MAVGLDCIALLLYCFVKVAARFLLDVLENYGIIFLPTTRGRRLRCLSKTGGEKTTTICMHIFKVYVSVSK